MSSGKLPSFSAPMSTRPVSRKMPPTSCMVRLRPSRSNSPPSTTRPAAFASEIMPTAVVIPPGETVLPISRAMEVDCDTRASPAALRSTAQR